MVCPVSLSFAVVGQRTSSLFRFGPGFFTRRGGLKKKRLAMSEPIHDTRLVRIVGGHLEFHSISDGQANKTLSHFSRNVREHKVIICQRDSKHRSRQHRRDRSLEAERLFRVHDLDHSITRSTAPELSAGWVIDHS